MAANSQIKDSVSQVLQIQARTKDQFQSVDKSSRPKKKLLISGEIQAEEIQDGEDQLNVQFYFVKKFNSRARLLLVYKWFTDNKSLVAMATVQCTYMIQCQASSWFISNLQLQLCVVGWIFNIPVRSSSCEKPKCLKYSGACTRRPPMKMKPL